MTAVVAEHDAAIGRRLRALQVGVGLQALMLWVAVEKLFQTRIGFDAASIGVMAAAYALVVPLLEIPSGVLADRWSRSGLLMVASGAAALSALVGGLSTNVATYVVAAMILGGYFAMTSGTVDSIVYDLVIEETGTGAAYEKWIGRVRVVESIALASSALLGGLLAGATSPRVTYFATVPFALASVVVLARFDEPRLHRASEHVALRAHLTTTVQAMTRIPQVRRVLVLAALTALLSQVVFEFGPLWLVAGHAPAAAFGPYWALLVSTVGVSGYLAGRLTLDRRATVRGIAGLVLLAPLLLTVGGSVAAATGQTVLLLLAGMISIHAGRLLHDAVPSAIRAGVSSGVGTLSWIGFLPFSLAFGSLLRSHGVHVGGWVLAATAALLAALLLVSTRTALPITANPGREG